jgi:hypothetical protein
MLSQKGGFPMPMSGFSNINTTAALPWMRNLVFDLMSVAGIEEVLIAPISLNTKPHRSQANTLCFYLAQVVVVDQKQIGQMILRLNSDDGTQGQDVLLIVNPSLAREESRLQVAVNRIKGACKRNFPFQITTSLSYREAGVAEINHSESTTGNFRSKRKRRSGEVDVDQIEEVVVESNWLRILSTSWPPQPSELAVNKDRSSKRSLNGR